MLGGVWLKAAEEWGSEGSMGVERTARSGQRGGSMRPLQQSGVLLQEEFYGLALKFL